jgi:hypothetical protein
LVITICDLGAKHSLAVCDDQVRNVIGVSQSDLGALEVNLDAVLDVGYQFLPPVDDQLRPVRSHVLDQNLNEAFFVDQQVNQVFGLWVRSLEVNRLELGALVNMLLQLLSFYLELCLAERVQALRRLLINFFFLFQQDVDLEFENGGVFANGDVLAVHNGSLLLDVAALLNLELMRFIFVVLQGDLPVSRNSDSVGVLLTG